MSETIYFVVSGWNANVMRRPRLAVILWAVFALSRLTQAGVDNSIANRLLSDDSASEYIKLTPTEKAEAITELNYRIAGLMEGRNHKPWTTIHCQFRHY